MTIMCVQVDGPFMFTPDRWQEIHDEICFAQTRIEVADP
jgi:hypothetical protein